MDPIWIEVAKQAPTTVVLVWLVVYFLRHLEGVNREHAERFASLLKTSQDREDHRDKERADDEERRETLTRASLDRNSSLFERILENIGKIKREDKPR